uniref:Uncharacterized protein AlNc14C18G1870 n=1 Tax=Albugo laibachii Nc14 TaxID=890382 RepID=F0W4P8_9STRA|nr:conserved hypothetical protein [Albugo laibachii Nc14]|eukprot:CCA16083.1 conserved hypothetical protein [Albugo laibachii Nc14]
MRGKNDRSDRNVCVYTVNHESRYIVVSNIPSVGALPELIERFREFGTICEHHILDHIQDREKFFTASKESDAVNYEFTVKYTDAVWIQYETVTNARFAKARGSIKPFYGNLLEIQYAPQSESVADTAKKLKERRELLHRRSGCFPECVWSGTKQIKVVQKRENEHESVFIGPQPLSSLAGVQNQSGKKRQRI